MANCPTEGETARRHLRVLASARSPYDPKTHILQFQREQAGCKEPMAGLADMPDCSEHSYNNRRDRCSSARPRALASDEQHQKGGSALGAIHLRPDHMARDEAWLVPDCSSSSLNRPAIGRFPIRSSDAVFATAGCGPEKAFWLKGIIINRRRRDGMVTTTSLLQNPGHRRLTLPKRPSSCKLPKAAAPVRSNGEQSRGL